jgi:hypothetical protein
MAKRIGFGGLCVILVILSGCAILQAVDQESNINRFKKGLSKAQLALGGAIPDGSENIGAGAYIDKSDGGEGILYFSEDDQVVYVSFYVIAVSPTGKMTDFSSSRAVYNSRGDYAGQRYDEMDEAEWVLEVYWGFLKKENFLLASGNGSPGTIYRKGSVYAGIDTRPQRDDGLIPLRMIFSRDLDLLRDFMNG